MMLPLTDDEVIELLRKLLKGRRVKIVTEQDFGMALTDKGVMIPTINDEGIFKRTMNVDYEATFAFILPSFTILLLDVRKEGKKRKKRKFAFVFLPQQFYIAEAIGNASIFGISSSKRRMMNIFSLGEHTKREVEAIGILHFLNALLPEMAAFHQQRALSMLKAAFPEAEWLIEYYTREAQVEAEEVST